MKNHCSYKYVYYIDHKSDTQVRKVSYILKVVLYAFSQSIPPYTHKVLCMGDCELKQFVAS